MRTNPRDEVGITRGNRRLVLATTVAAVFGMLMSGTSSVPAAQASAGEAQASDVQSYPATGTSGDRGVGRVYRQQRAIPVETQQGVQSAPVGNTAGDRGVNQPQSVAGEEVYMGRMSRRATGETRGTVGDRGVNQPYTMRKNQTRLDVDELQSAIDALQAMYDDAQARLDARRAMIERARWNAAAGTSGDHGINRVYRPEQSAYYLPEFSGDTYRAPAAGSYGDRGVNRVYRDERTYRERTAHELSGQNVDLYGPGGMTLPQSQAALDALADRLDEQQARMGPRTSGDKGVNRVQRGTAASTAPRSIPERSALRRTTVDEIERPGEARRYYPAAGTSGDVGVNRVWREPMLDREQSRLEREQRLLDRGQRKVDRLQRKLDRQVDRYTRMSAGDRGVSQVAEPGQAVSVQTTIERLFSQLDQNGDESLSATEAKRLAIVDRNLAELDEDGNGALTLNEFRSIVEESEAL